MKTIINIRRSLENLKKGGEVKMKAYTNKILYKAAILALLMGFLPSVAYANDSAATGSFGCNNAAPTITSVTLQQSDKTTSTSAMTPVTDYNVKIVAGDANTISDITQIDIWIFYEADSNHNGAPSGSWDCDQEAIYRWAKSGSTWSMQNISAVTTWGITTLNCDTPSPMTATSGTWNLYFTVGKLAVNATGSSTAWDIKVLVTDAQAAAANTTVYNNAMYAYASLALSSATVDFGNMALGDTAAIQTPPAQYVTLQAIANSVFSLGSKSSATWSTGSSTATLDTADGSPAAGQFSLAQGTASSGGGHPSSPQYIGSTTADITGHSNDGRTSTAAGASEATNNTNMYMDCILASSGLAVGTYTGSITYTITNK